MPIPHSLPHVRLLLILLFILLASPAGVRAQVPKADVFFGYSRTGASTFSPNEGGLNGWEGAFNVKVKPLLGVEGDVSHYGLGAGASIPRTTAVLFGPRVTVGVAGIKLFAHGLLGGEHSSSSTGISNGAFALALGGGVDVPFAPFFAWRVQGDYLNATTESPAIGNHARFTTGLAFRF